MFDRTTLCRTSVTVDELYKPLPWGKKERLEAEDQWQWLEENMRDSTLVGSFYKLGMHLQDIFVSENLSIQSFLCYNQPEFGWRTNQEIPKVWKTSKKTGDFTRH